jgi:hypothetical protein
LLLHGLDARLHGLTLVAECVGFQPGAGGAGGARGRDGDSGFSGERSGGSGCSCSFDASRLHAHVVGAYSSCDGNGVGMPMCLLSGVSVVCVHVCLLVPALCTGAHQ